MTPQSEGERELAQLREWQKGVLENAASHAAERREYRSVLSAIIANGCRSASEIDGSLRCFFCGEDFDGTTEKHAPECAYIRAKKLTS